MTGNPSTAYRRGSRLPEHIEAYNTYMKEYMRNWRDKKKREKEEFLRSTIYQITKLLYDPDDRRGRHSE